MKKKYRFIGVPLKYGCNVEGSDLGIERLSSEINFDEIMSIPDYEEEFVPNQRNIKKVIEVCNGLAKIVDETIDHEQIPIVIGGDHALAIGSVAGDSKNHEIGILWIDSHADINTDATTETGNIHGFPLAISIGYGTPDLVRCYQPRTKVKEENIVLFGCTDVDPLEKEFIQEHGIKIFYDSEILERGLEPCLEEAANYLKSHVDHIHLSLDIDSMDPLVAPGVNIDFGISIPTRNGTGFQIDDMNKILDCVLKLPLSAIDIVEYNPLKDKSGVTLSIVKDIIETITKSMN